MAGPQVLQSSGHSRWKQWWRRSPNTCCSKKILLLLVWLASFTFSRSVLVYAVPTYIRNGIVLQTSIFLSSTFAPLIGWLADVRFGRYEVIKFSSIVYFLASILYYFAMFAGESVSTLSTATAMLPFLTADVFYSFSTPGNFENVFVFVVPLAVIIISDLS